MQITDLLPLFGDIAVIAVLTYVVTLFVEGKIFSAKAMERVATALGAEMATRLEKGMVTQFEALNVREERIFEAVKSVRGDDEIRDLLVELRGIKRATDTQIKREQLQPQTEFP